MQKKKWDVFLSHASEDKDDFTDEIVSGLEYFGVKVWYDSTILSVGDNLSKTIDTGLLYSKYGIVVLSDNFIKKGWPEYEFRSLLNREIRNKKVILPIWHKTKIEDVEKYSPFLVGKYALNSSKQTIDQIVISLIKVIRPKIYKNIHREILWRKIKDEAKIENINRTQIIADNKIQHKSLPKHLMLRIENLYYSVFSILGTDIQEVIHDFKQEYRPQDEIAVWEFIYLCYQKYLDKTSDSNNKKNILNQFLLFSLGILDKTDEISEDTYVKLLVLWKENFTLFFNPKNSVPNIEL